ncbi:hypothetical protein DICPUDRAFT_91899 [Dictyostelium purpureum]|uniref:Cystatin domain-containing protein n=1 Tax=Dictyostelium purpureum TaxID=5786 RepID=F0ZIX0_DICPU|nr:uncharacterized protein DICPUDRAFT_91899 [Dictyostelium purpureum]EGC36100.1 hypothetical protein DICPUDRAFT_91899 [Dictyostelium purpureum]|eukprot:XP_003287357.1 hypothetical protein DICPUDRAFT_91899 [Dictyostelium purpureum]
MGIVGGIGAKHDADDYVRNLCAQIKVNAENKLATHYNKFEAVSYKKQVVAGTNYFVKVHTDNGYNHYRIFVGLPVNGKEAAPQLVSVQQNKSLEDDITYF